MKFLVATIIFFALLLIPAEAQTLSGTALIRIFSITNATTSLDLGRSGRSAGDQSFQGIILYDRQGQIIGHGSLICTALGRTLPDEISQCTADYVLPRGKIAAIGSRRRADYYILSIVGGTGLYSNAMGILLVRTIALNPRRERLFFSLES